MKSGIWILTYSKQLIKLLPARDSNLNYIEILRSKHVFGAKRSLLRLHFSHSSPETNQTEIWHPRSVSWKYKIQIYFQSPKHWHIDQSVSKHLLLFARQKTLKLWPSISFQAQLYSLCWSQPAPSPPCPRSSPSELLARICMRGSSKNICFCCRNMV